MDAHYVPHQFNQFDEVDQFLKKSYNNFDFWSRPSTVTSIPINGIFEVYDPTQPRRYDEQQLNVANFSVSSPVATTFAVDGCWDKRPAGSTTQSPPAKFHRPQPPPPANERLYAADYPTALNEGGKCEKRKKSSTFKSVRSFFKRHIFSNHNNNNNNNDNNYGKLYAQSEYDNRKKRLSSASLHDYSKPNSSADVVNSSDYPDRACSHQNDSQLTRAHSYSSSKMRHDSFTAHSGDRYASTAGGGRPPVSPRVPVSHYYSPVAAAALSPSRSSSSALSAGGYSTVYDYDYVPRTHATASASSRLVVPSEPPSSSSSERARSIAVTGRSNHYSGDGLSSAATTSQGSQPVGVKLSTAADFDNLSSTPNGSSTAGAKLTAGSTTPQVTPICETPCLNGILNHGNTCYMNALMQCLACIDRFAQFFVCEHFNNRHLHSSNSEKTPAAQTLASILQCLWLNVAADGACLKLLKFMSSECPHFRLSTQQDAQESLTWILDRIHEEIKDVPRDQKSDFLTKQFKSEEQLASDALKRVSGSNNSAIMDLFRAQFRSSMECASCGFTNLTFDPYMTVSLSVLQSNCLRSCAALFVPYFNGRQIVRYYLPISAHISTTTDVMKSRRIGVSTIFHVKQQIMRSLGGTEDNLVGCQFSANGQCKFLPNDMPLEDALTDLVNDCTMVEIPKLNDIQEHEGLVIAIVTYINGYYPNGLRHGLPYVIVVNRQSSYDELVRSVLMKGLCVLKTTSIPAYSNFKLLLQHSTDGVIHLESGVTMPLFHQSVGAHNQEAVFRIIVEWNPSSAAEYLCSESEMVINDHTFEREAMLDWDSSSVTLTSLLQDYIKSETVADWKCPKCLKTSGRKELKFHSIPPVLVFHLKRFELHNDGGTKKIDTKVRVPLEALDMSPYICNPDSRFSTLRTQREVNGYARARDAYEYPLYDLVGVVRHHGERANSGHYTATARNPLDQKWRNFDDLKVTLLPPSDEVTCTSADAYLLFYERRKTSNDLIKFDNTTVTSRTSSRWFPAEVPPSVFETCEQQRARSRDSLDRNRESLRKELNDFSLANNNDGDKLRPAYQSGGSTFYTGSALDRNGGGNMPPSSNIARSYTEHNGVGASQGHVVDRYGSLPFRRSSMSFKTSSSNNKNNCVSDYVSPVSSSPVGWLSSSPRQPYQSHVLRSNTNVSASPLPQNSYYYETVGGIPPLSKIYYGVGPATSGTRADLYRYNGPLLADSERGGVKNDQVYSPSSSHNSLADSPRRSKSQYALSSGSRGARSPLPSAYYAPGSELGSYRAHTPLTSTISGRSRSSIRGVGGGGANLLATPSSIKSYSSSYRR